MFKRKAFKRFVALVTVLLLTISTVSVGFAATGTSASTDPTVVYATKDGKTLMFTFTDIVNAYALGNTTYQALWEGSTKLSVTVGGKNVSFPDFVTAFGTGAAADLAAFAATASAVKAPANVNPVAAIGTVGAEKLNAASVNAIADITAVFGTALDKVGLPAQVDVTLANGDVVKSDVAWNAGTPAFDGSKPGTYAFEGTVTGTDLKAAVNVIVSNDQAAPIVASSSVVDYKTLKVVFNEKVKGTPVVKLNWVPVDAKYVTPASDGMSLTVTSPNGLYAAGTLVLLINGLTDMAGNPMAQNTEVSIVKAASYAAQFTINTTGGVANSIFSPAVRVEWSAVDQYGYSYTGAGITASASIGSYPLRVNSNFDGSYSIQKDAVMTKGSVINFTLTSTVNNAVVASASKNLVLDDQSSTASVITSFDFAAETTFVPGSPKTVQISILDQYGNVVQNPYIRWTTSDASVIAINGTAGSYYDYHGNSMDFTFVKAGTATITAVSKDNVNLTATKTITVQPTPPATLTTIGSLVFAQADKFNYETVTSSPLTFTANAILTPAMLSFEVTAKPTGSDITLSAGYDADGKIRVYATTNADGTYTFNAFTYVGTTKVSTTGTITTGKNPAVTSMTVAPFNANELTAGKAVAKAITFKNVHGEVVSLRADKLNVLPTSNMKVIKVAKDANGNPVKDANGNLVAIADEANTDVAFLGYTGTAAGNDTVTLVTGSLVLQVYTTTVAKSVISSFELGTSSVTVITEDPLDEVVPKVDDLTVMYSPNNAMKAVKITFFDQYGNPVESDGVILTYAGTDTSTEPCIHNLANLADGSMTGNDGVKYLGVHAYDGTTTQYVTIKMVDENDNTKVLDTAQLMVNVLEARKAQSFTLKSFSTSVMQGVAQTVLVDKVVDQYGRDYVPGAGYSWEIASDANNAAVTVAGMAVTAAKSGTENITVKLNLTVGTTTTVVDSKSYTMIVNSIDDIGSLSLSSVGTLNVQAKTGVVVTPFDSAAMGFVVRNINGIAIDVPAAKVAWSTSDSSVATVLNGVVTAKKAGTAVIKGLTENGKEATMTVTVVDSAFALTSISFVNAPATVKLNTTADLAATLKYFSNSVELVKAYALTGYTLEFTSTNAAVATVDSATGVVTPVAEGTTTIVVKVMAGTTFTGIYTTMNVTVIPADI